MGGKLTLQVAGGPCGALGPPAFTLYRFVGISTSNPTHEVLRGDITVDLPVIGHPLKRVMPAEHAVAPDGPLPRFRVELKIKEVVPEST
jgi:hypothetical protein